MRGEGGHCPLDSGVERGVLGKKVEGRICENMAILYIAGYNHGHYSFDSGDLSYSLYQQNDTQAPLSKEL